MSSGSGGKSLVKSVGSHIRLGNAAQVVDNIKEWTGEVNVPLSNWDLIVGAALWNRCMDKDMPVVEEETSALEEIYECLIREFFKNSGDTKHYLERLKVFAATLKYFVQKKRLNLKLIEDLLQEVSRTSFYVRQNEYACFKNVCMNFYALIWNYMRDNHTHFGLLESLAHSSLSVRWLVVLGLEQFQNISQKLSQSFLLAKSHAHFTNATIADFFFNFSTQLVDLLKKVIVDDSNNGAKVKKKKRYLPVSHFHGILNLTFVLARQLVIFGDFDKAIKVFRPITSVAQIYFEDDLRQVWKNLLDAFVKMCMIVGPGTNVRPSDDLLKSSDLFRDCRKQILDVSFQKAYPGYAFSFMYACTESIGLVITSSKSNGSSAPLLKLMENSKCAKFLKEIQFAADACVALDDMQSGKPALEGITENRKVEVYSIALFHVLKMASDRICNKDEIIGKDLQQVTEAAYSTLMTLANRIDLDVSKSAELFSLITFHTCNIGFAYQKRKSFKDAMSWCYRSIDAYEAFKSKKVKMDLKINPLSIGLLLADCHRQLENYTEGLRWLSKWLVIAPEFVDAQSTAYDVYEQLPWTDWSVHWQSIQKEVCSQDPEKCLSVVEYLEDDDPDSVTDEFASKALRLEMNAYFSGRQTIVPAILNVGHELEKRNICLADKVLGLVCQAVGLWWVGSDESLDLAASCIREAVNILNEPDDDEKEKENCISETYGIRTYLSGVVLAWKALCVLKTNQIVAEYELEKLKDRIIQENPKKKEKVDGLYAVPAFTSLTIDDESNCAANFIDAAKCFYQLSQIEDGLKSIMDSHCPALGQITVRMIAHGLSALGEKLNAAKAWYATFVISKIYDRKGLVVLAASEVLKILPYTSLECVQYAEKVNAAANEGNLIKYNKAVSYRLDLAKAAACYHQKNFEEGLMYLAEVYKSERDNFDSTHHLMAEADYVLSLYRSATLNRSLDFPDGIPELLSKMTPAGLTVKAYKLLGSLSRETDVLSSGWTDLLHNYYLLGSIAEISSRTVKLLKETGKLRDLKCFVTDAVYFYQRLGIVSRSIATLVPLIETDIAARNFHMAQIRIAAVARVFLATKLDSEEDKTSMTDAKKFLETHLKSSGLSINRLENVSNLKWYLGDIDATSFHYRNRSAKYLNSLKVDCAAINIKSLEMKAPTFLRHPLTCFCYTCSHPEIIPCVLEFLVAQSKYAVAMKWKISMAVLELARLHHQRSMFRVLFNMESITDQLQPIVIRKTAAELVNMIYCSFFFNPGFQMQLANMEMCPVADISHIIHLMKATLSAADIVDSEDLSLKVLPLEIGTCALYEYLISTKRIPVLAGTIREAIQARVEQQEKENTVLIPSSPEIMEMTVPPVAPPVLRRRPANPPLTMQQQHGRKATVTNLRPRRILNSKAQQQPEVSSTVELIDLTKVDNLDEERHLPIIPAPNFDDSNDD